MSRRKKYHVSKKQKELHAFLNPEKKRDAINGAPVEFRRIDDSLDEFEHNLRRLISLPYQDIPTPAPAPITWGRIQGKSGMWYGVNIDSISVPTIDVTSLDSVGRYPEFIAGTPEIEGTILGGADVLEQLTEDTFQTNAQLICEITTNHHTTHNYGYITYLAVNIANDPINIAFTFQVARSEIIQT